MSSHSGEAGDVERERKRQRHAEPEKNMISVMDPTTTDQLDMVLEAAQVQPKDRPSSSGTKSESPSYFEYDVFINFRGEDTRKSFVGHLYRALVQRGVRAYLDSEDLDQGDSINDLFIAIERSAAFITVFSKRYAESKWCLMEIEKIVHCDRNILPIFYDVEPTEVRNQIGAFKEGFEKHMHREEVDKWKEALSKAATISGYVLEENYHGDEARLIADVVKKVLDEICNKVRMQVAEHPVGMDFHLRKMTDMLRIDQVNEVRFVGICGIGGLGKTTVAKATFNEFRLKFERSSFLENVRGKEGGILQLQKDLIRELFNDQKDPNISNASRGIELIKQRVQGNKVLVILDDVDSRDQIQYLVGDGTWLHEGSRIVITTRDRGVLVGDGLVEETHIYAPDKLDENQSLELFSHFAFKRVKHIDIDKYVPLAREVIDSIGRLPLVLKVLGSHFSRFNVELWGDLLKKLKMEPHKDVQKILRISFDDLEDEEKLIFLDIACFFLQQDYPKNAIYMWKSCNLVPELSLEVLEQKSLLERGRRGQFQMHDEIRDMALEIIRQEDPKHSLARSRVYKSDGCLELMTSHFKEGSIKTEALLFDGRLNATLTRRSVLAMSNLKMFIGSLQCYDNSHHQLKYDFDDKEETVEKHESDSIVTCSQLPQPNWLRWCHYPFKTLPQQVMKFDQLAVLELPHFASKCLRLKSSRCKEFHNLKVLDLSDSDNLKKTPDFSVMPHLERLDLSRCGSLKEISPSIGQLKNLMELNLEECRELEKLVGEIGCCTSLKVLKLDECSRLSTLPKDIDNLTNLSELNLYKCSSIVSLPKEIGYCTSLKVLNLSFCDRLSSLPKDIGNLTNLSELNLHNCSSIVSLPEEIGYCTSLKVLTLQGCSELSSLPKSIGNLANLTSLNLHECSSIVSLPEEICRYSSLQQLYCSWCRSLSSLPTDIGNLTSLTELGLSHTGIVELPESFSKLTMLKELDLTCCSSLKELPSTIGSLKQLQRLLLSSTAIRELPSSIGNCTSLTELDCLYCYNLSSLPMEIGSSTLLKKLDLGYCSSLKELPSTIGCLEQLQNLSLRKTSISGLPGSIFSRMTMLKKLDLGGCSSLKELPSTLGCLEQLQEIDLSETSISELPSSLGQLKHLVKLNLSCCDDLVMLPEEMCDCTSIRQLNCIFCTSLSSLPRDIGNLTSLSRLNLNRSGITELPDSFSSLTKLSQLGLGLYLPDHSNSQLMTPALMRRLFHTVEFHKLNEFTIPGLKPSEQLFENRKADAVLQFTLPNFATRDHETKVIKVKLRCYDRDREAKINGLAVTSSNQLLYIKMFNFTLSSLDDQDLTDQLGRYLVGKKAVEVWLLRSKLVNMWSKLVNMWSKDALGDSTIGTIRCYLSIKYDYYWREFTWTEW